MVLACLSLLACNPHVSLAASDILLVNGNVYTASISSPWAQADAPCSQGPSAGHSRTQLDAAVADRPLVIHAPTEHSLWLNSKARP